MKRKSTKKYRHDMIQAWVNQVDNKWVQIKHSECSYCHGLCPDDENLRKHYISNHTGLK